MRNAAVFAKCDPPPSEQRMDWCTWVKQVASLIIFSLRPFRVNCSVWAWCLAIPPYPRPPMAAAQPPLIQPTGKRTHRGGRPETQPPQRETSHSKKELGGALTSASTLQRSRPPTQFVVFLESFVSGLIYEEKRARTQCWVRGQLGKAQMSNFFSSTWTQQNT